MEVSAVAGTGTGGRVTEDDVRRAGSFGQTSAGERVPVSPVRRAVADVLTRQAAIPQVTTFRTVDCTALEEFRRGLGVSPLPVVAAALCRTISGHPIINAAWDGDTISMRAAVHLGIAVDTVAELARGGRLAPADTQGATVGISNTGSYGSEAGTPILTPGSSVTIAVGVIAPRALVVEGEVVARPACTLSLTFDHRVLDGAAAGRALTELVGIVQDADRLRDLPA